MTEFRQKLATFAKENGMKAVVAVQKETEKKEYIPLSKEYREYLKICRRREHILNQDFRRNKR